jgi:hypothetical protein
VTRYFGNTVDLNLNSDELMDSGFLLQQARGGSGVFFYVAAALKTTGGYVGTRSALEIESRRKAPRLIHITQLSSS